MATQIADRIFAVGVADPERRTFHGHEMSTAQGTTYNAYLIVDEKEVVLVDTSYAPTTDALLANIRKVVDPAKITVIIACHAEPDHAGALAAVKALAPRARILCSKKGTESLAGWHHADWPLEAVAGGDTLDTGTLRLTFIMAMMCHWPDNMMVHISLSRAQSRGSVGSGDAPDVLLSSDAFGQHYTRAMFDDQAGDAAELWFEAEKYFVNIIAPYCRNVLQRLDELAASGLTVRMIAPAHGCIWRRGVAEILEAYRRYAEQRTERRAVICYDTMYESTRALADAIAKGLDDAGVPHRIYHLPTADRSDVLTDLYSARGILIGSSTWHMNVLPTVATLLEDLKTLRFKGRAVGAFGSYGWQKRNVEIIEKRAREAGLDVPVGGVLCQWKPQQADLDGARAFGREFAGHLVQA